MFSGNIEKKQAWNVLNHTRILSFSPNKVPKLCYFIYLDKCYIIITLIMFKYFQGGQHILEILKKLEYSCVEFLYWKWNTWI